MSTEDNTSEFGDVLDVGDVLQGRYELKKKLGEGGFAVVYLAFDDTIERNVAIKVLNTDRMATEGESAKLVRSRFLREARLAAQIRHPSIIEIYDFGVLEELDQPYMIMEFLEGKDLDEELEEKGALIPERFLPLFIEALEALGEAHEKGVVHKDLKPANLFLTNPGTKKETLKVVDFGIAHADHQAEERLTKTGAMTGTPHYLPPEYLEEQEVLTEMDVYQMGLILIESLSGHRVVTAETVFQAVLKHVNRDLSIPPALLSGKIGTVIQRAIAYDTDLRYSTATEFAEALTKIDPKEVIDFNDPHTESGLKPVSLAKTIDSGLVEPLTDDEESLSIEREALAETMISQELHVSGAQSKVDHTQQEFGTTQTSPLVESDGESRPNTERVTSDLPSTTEGPSSDNPGSLSSEQVEAAFGSTWPLKLLGGLAVAVVVAFAVVVFLVIADDDDDEEVADDEATVVETDTLSDDGDEPDEPAVAETDDSDGDDEVPADEDSDDESVSIAIDSSPSGASVEKPDGAVVGTTPTELELDEGQQQRLIVNHSGYQSQEIVVDAAEADEEGLEIALDEEEVDDSEPTGAPTVVDEPADPTPASDPVAEAPEEEPEVDDGAQQEEEADEDDDAWALPGQDEDEEDDDDDETGGFDLAQ